MLDRLYDRDGVQIDMVQWSLLFEDKAYCRVAFDEIEGVSVSTVWLGIDHNFYGDGPPLIFETMIFGRELDQEQWRYATEYDARVGHQKACDLVAWEASLA